MMEANVRADLARARPLSARRLEQAVRTNDVRTNEFVRTRDRSVDVRFGSTVNDAVDGLVVDGLCDGIRIAYVLLDKAEVLARIGLRNARSIAGVGERVDHDDSSFTMP